MKEMKRNPIGYRTVTRMEEESASRNEEQAQAEPRSRPHRSISKQAAGSTRPKRRSTTGNAWRT